MNLNEQIKADSLKYAWSRYRLFKSRLREMCESADFFCKREEFAYVDFCLLKAKDFSETMRQFRKAILVLKGCEVVNFNRSDFGKYVYGCDFKRYF